MGVTELAIAGLAAAAVGGGVSAYSSIQAGQAGRQAANYQAAVAMVNKQMSENSAKVAKVTGEQEEQAKREQIAQITAQQRAHIGGAGLDPNSGSSLRLQTDTAQLGELDALTIRSAAQRAAYGFNVGGASYAGQAALDMAQGRYAAEAGNLGAASSLIGGASSVGDKWARYKQSGVSAGAFS